MLNIRPHWTYPTTYRGSWTEIEIRCECHPGMICGTGRRTGLTFDEEWPVYRLHSFTHPELNGASVALSPDGFVWRSKNENTRTDSRA